MIPQIDNSNDITTTTKIMPSKTYKLVDDRIVGFVDGKEALQQAIYHTLMTERYAYLIYTNNYGVELEQYYGKDFDYLKMSIENTIKEALTYDLRIKSVQVTEITQQDDKAIVKFVVYSTYGDLQMEVKISV